MFLFLVFLKGGRITKDQLCVSVIYTDTSTSLRTWSGTRASGTRASTLNSFQFKSPKGYEDKILFNLDFKNLKCFTIKVLPKDLVKGAIVMLNAAPRNEPPFTVKLVVESFTKMCGASSNQLAPEDKGKGPIQGQKRCLSFDEVKWSGNFGIELYIFDTLAASGVYNCTVCSTQEVSHSNVSSQSFFKQVGGTSSKVLILSTCTFVFYNSPFNFFLFFKTLLSLSLVRQSRAGGFCAEIKPQLSDHHVAGDGTPSSTLDLTADSTALLLEDLVKATVRPYSFEAPTLFFPMFKKENKKTNQP